MPVVALNGAPPAQMQVRRGSVDGGEILPFATMHGLSMGALSLSAGIEIRLRAAPLGSWWSFGFGFGFGMAFVECVVGGRAGGFGVAVCAVVPAVLGVGVVLVLGRAE